MAEEETVVDDTTDVITGDPAAPVTDAPVDTTVTGGDKAPTLADAIDAGLDAEAGKEPAKKPAGEGDGKEGEASADGKDKDADKDPADKKPDEKEGEKKPDHVNDPIPAQVSERTRERITSLVDTVKTQAADLKVQGDLINTIQETGASPEQFGEMISFMRDFNATDMASVERAYETMKTTMKALSIRLGRAIPEADIVADFPDIAQQLKYGQITKEVAHELAVNRMRTKINGESAAKTKKQSDDQKQYATEKGEAITALNTLGASLQKRDGLLYAAKFDDIIPKLKKLYETLPPTQWEAAFHREYNMSTAKPKPVPDPTPDPTPKPQPIRPITPAGGGGNEAKTAPKSLADAISAGITAGS